MSLPRLECCDLLLCHHQLLLELHVLHLQKSLVLGLLAQRLCHFLKLIILGLEL